MFTGIIEELAVVKNLERNSAGARLSIRSKTSSLGTLKGDSISVNGACLTAIDIKDDIILFDISSETLYKTNLSRLNIGDYVNIERSLKVNSRISGHFVTGHIDGTGRIVSKELQGKFIKLDIELPEDIIVCLAKKGPVAVDGVSLTVNTLKEKSFSVLLIPHTMSVTTLGYKEIGDYVNIEVDILAKYVQRVTTSVRDIEPDIKPSNLTKEFLKGHGFI